MPSNQKRSNNDDYFRQSECSEGDAGDVTPCNLSPSTSALVSMTPPNFRSLTVVGTVSASHSLDDIDPSWRTQFQILVTEGGPNQLVSALHLLPKLYRVIIHWPFFFFFFFF